MKLNSTYGLAALLVATSLTAQDCPRPEVQLSSGTVTTSVRGYGGWRITAPEQSLPADALNGLDATARVMYAVWPDANASGDIVIRFLKSNDGGWSWDTQNAIDIWTANTAAGETFDTNRIDLFADGHAVFVVFTADRDPAGVPDPSFNDSCWVLGSDDQGQTWQALNISPALYTPLPNGDDLNDVDDPFADVSGTGRLHVIFEADYDVITGGNPGDTGEDAYYQAVEFQGGVLTALLPNELRLSTASPALDIDWPVIAADGNVVICGWHDPTVLGGDSDDMVSRVSTDGGLTFGAIHNHTNFTADQGEDRPRAAVRGNTIVLVQGDTRLGTTDQLFASLSFDAGATWTDNLPISRGPVTDDVDAFDLEITNNGTIFVAYNDDRQGAGNVDNDVYVVVDQNGGQDFLNNTHFEVLLTTGSDNDTTHQCESHGDVLVVAAETSSYPEDGGIFVSRDSGTSWEYFAVSSGQVADVDDVFAAVTVNGDVQVTWQDDDNLGNSFNNVYTRGLKAQLIVENPATGLTYQGGTAADAGDLVVLFPSLVAPASNGTVPPMPVTTGVAYNFVLDGVSVAALSNISLFLGVIDGSGNATFALGTINLAQVLGQDIHWFGATLDSSNGQWSRAYTDPYTQH